MRLGIFYFHALGNGGYPRDLRWLASVLADQSLYVTLFCTRGHRGQITEGLSQKVHIESPDSLTYRNDIDIYHIFGIFLLEHIWQLIRLLGKPLVVSPMGHLMPFHLRRKAFKKSIYLRIVKPVLRKVGWFHVFSPIEASSVQQYLGRSACTFEAGLGVFPLPMDIELNRIENVYENKATDFLFFGRNDVYQKGIDILLRGFAKAVKWGANATLTIAGQPWGNSERYIRRIIEKEKLGEWVRVLGLVGENVKWELLREADYLVFLSRWDGPPRPIREAIAVGTPVIVSPETNMGHLVTEFNAGIEVSLDAEKVAQAIIAVSQDRLKQVEHRAGVVKLRERLDWSRVAEDYISGYEQVLAGWK